MPLHHGSTMGATAAGDNAACGLCSFQPVPGRPLAFPLELTGKNGPLPHQHNQQGLSTTSICGFHPHLELSSEPTNTEGNNDRIAQRNKTTEIRNSHLPAEPCWPRTAIRRTWCTVTRFRRSNNRRRRALDILRHRSSWARTTKTSRLPLPVRPVSRERELPTAMIRS